MKRNDLLNIVDFYVRVLDHNFASHTPIRSSKCALNINKSTSCFEIVHSQQQRKYVFKQVEGRASEIQKIAESFA